MKNLRHILLLLAGIAFATACTDDFDEMNQDPNRATEIQNAPYLLLTPMQKRAVTKILDEAWSGGNLNAQYAAKIVFTDYDLYNWGSNSGIWNDLYKSAREAQTLETIAPEGYKVISKIMKVWSFQQLTDLYGDIPYSEALKAKSEANYAPKYDSQQSIYTELVKELKEANQLLKQTYAPVQGDVINDSDFGKWRKLSNALLLRVYMRMSEVNPSAAEAGIKEIVGNASEYPLLASNADNSVLKYGTTGPDAAPHTKESGSREGSFDEYRMSETLEGVLRDLDDPRMARWFRPTAKSLQDGTPEFSGMKNGMADGVAYSYKGGSLNLSRFAPLFFDEPNTVQGIMMTYSEQEFILAEAAQRGWVSGGETHYNNAVTASFDYWKVTIPADYLQRDKVKWDNSLERVMKQKWLSNMLNGFEGFSDYRRTGFPTEITPGPDAVYDYVPFRYEYPQKEQSLNEANYNAAVSTQGADQVTTKIWWIK
ncbi:SusD/RagB family nutrient-binding outer membrane lipoprotein [Fulvitalea axinellae]